VHPYGQLWGISARRSALFARCPGSRSESVDQNVQRQLDVTTNPDLVRCGPSARACGFRFAVNRDEAREKNIHDHRCARTDYRVAPEYATLRRFFAVTGMSVTRDSQLRPEDATPWGAGLEPATGIRPLHLRRVDNYPFQSTLTARAATTATTTNAISVSAIIRTLARPDSGRVSVGLNAVAVVNATNV
jgi:hypothetical protein